MTEHRQVCIKVNAEVDEGVTDLVSALSDFEGLITIESCQGEPGRHDAFVLFHCRDWRSCGSVMFDKIYPALDPNLRAVVSLSVETLGEDAALGRVGVDPAKLSELAAAVGRVVSCDRTTECSGDT